MKSVIISFCLSFVVFFSFAQEKPMPKSEKSEKKAAQREKVNNLIRQQEEGALVFNKQTAFGVRLNTDGWGLMLEKGKMKNVVTTNFISLEINVKKDPKEKKLNNLLSNSGFLQIGSPYVYGKQNSFYQIKPTFGQMRLLGGKTNKNGVAVQGIYGVGISIGLERPYYVRVQDSGPSGTRDIKYSVADSALFLGPGNIIMGTGLRYGWNQLKIIPGAHAKAALRFDYGRFNELVSAIEVGMNIEAYSRKVNIMLNNPSHQVFFNGYISILFGRRK